MSLVARAGAVVGCWAVALAAAGCGSSGDPAVVQLTEADDGSTISMDVGETLVVTLESNPSTGYVWDVVDPLPVQLEPAGEPELLPAEDEDLVGAPGSQEFTFDVVAGGSGRLRLVYVRPWEDEVEPAETFEVTVEAP